MAASAPAPAPTAALYVGDLDQSTNEQQLYEVFSGVGACGAAFAGAGGRPRGRVCELCGNTDV